MKENLLTVQDIAKELNTTTITVYRWINWWYSDLPKPDNVFLPKYIKFGKNKLFKQEDLLLFKRFKETMPRGLMSEYNNFYFGRRDKTNSDTEQRIKKTLINQKINKI